MLTFVLPDERHRADVLAFYAEFETANETCIGYNHHSDFDKWLREMQNRKTGENLPEGYVRENFYLCYDEAELVGVLSLKFELTPYLLNFGGHVGYAVKLSKRNRGYATAMMQQCVQLAGVLGFERLLLVCDEDNIASEKVIRKCGGIFEDQRYDDDEGEFVKRYWINV